MSTEAGRDDIRTGGLEAAQARLWVEGGLDSSMKSENLAGTVVTGFAVCRHLPRKPISRFESAENEQSKPGIDGSSLFARATAKLPKDYFDVWSNRDGGLKLE
jgi:hypothetical protein